MNTTKVLSTVAMLKFRYINIKVMFLNACLSVYKPSKVVDVVNKFV